MSKRKMIELEIPINLRKTSVAQEIILWNLFERSNGGRKSAQTKREFAHALQALRETIVRESLPLREFAATASKIGSHDDPSLESNAVSSSNFPETV